MDGEVCSALLINWYNYTYTQYVRASMVFLIASKSSDLSTHIVIPPEFSINAEC